MTLFDGKLLTEDEVRSRQLSETEIAIARTEQEISLYPDERGLHVTLTSLKKRRDNLAREEPNA